MEAVTRLGFKRRREPDGRMIAVDVIPTEALKMEQIGTAHKLIQSGKTIGKLVMIAGGRRE